MRLSRFALLFVLLAACTGCQALRYVETQLTYLTVPPSQEAVMGGQFAQQVEVDAKLLDDPAATAWLNEMAARLVEHSPPSSQTFTFKLTADESVNAFAIPGGYCYVNIGLLKLADNEAQVASVVGHEINHVTTRHGVRKLQRLYGMELSAAVVSLIEPRASSIASAVKDSGGVLAMRGFGRSDEREADRLGVLAMYGAGYDPRQAAVFFEKMQAWQEAQGGGDGGFFSRMTSTHPATDERIRNIQKHAAALDLTVPLITDTDDFQALKARLGI